MNKTFFAPAAVALAVVTGCATAPVSYDDPLRASPARSFHEECADDFAYVSRESPAFNKVLARCERNFGVHNPDCTQVGRLRELTAATNRVSACLKANVVIMPPGVSLPDLTADMRETEQRSRRLSRRFSALADRLER